MKPLLKPAFALLLFLVLASSCEKYTYTPPPIPPAGYYDYITSGIEYNGNLIVAGNFSALFGSARNIAQWNGSSWQSLGNGFSNYPEESNYGGSSVLALAVYNGNLIVAGNFDSAGGKPTNCIAQWNGSSWQELDSGVTGNNGMQVNALAVYNGNLIVAGGFQHAGSVAVNDIAEWNGSSWQTTIGGTNEGGVINALAVYNGNLIAGGEFTTIGGENISNLAQWNGTTWSQFTGESNYDVTGLVVYNGNLIAQGYFDTIESIPMYSRTAVWNGSTWTASNASFTSYPYFIPAVVYSGNLYSSSQTSLSRWSGNGYPAVIGTCSNNKETYYNQSIQPNINQLCVYNGNLIVGGWFTSVNGVNCSYNLAKWNGSSWSSF